MIGTSPLSRISALPGLAEVESLIASKFVSEAPRISEISSYLLGLGGKRIRPVLTLLCGELFGVSAPFLSSQRGSQLIDIAAGIELIHMATLLHDDIIDKSSVRRHKPSPYALFGTDRTLLTGDFLLTRAFGLCARLDRFIIDRTEQACIDLTEGEILETVLCEERHTVDSSLLIARKKTASLFALAAEASTHIAGAEDSVVAAMATFGSELGVAFQILDDVLDVISDEATLGKKSGQDLRERKPSIINVLWLASGDPLAAPLLTPPSSKQASSQQASSQAASARDDSWIAESLTALRSGKGLAGESVAAAQRMAAEFVSGASTALDSALALARQNNQSLRPGSSHGLLSKEAEGTLRSLMSYVLQRVS